MSRISYVNGAYLPHASAKVHIEDRGYQFSDAVYEGFEVHESEVVDFERHIARLERSMDALSIKPPPYMPAIRFIFRELIRKNRVRDGFAYLQVSRGVAPRNHIFPAKETISSLIMTVRPTCRETQRLIMQEGVGVITTPDIRWKRVDIKSVGLLANVLARQEAAEKGAREAWLVDDNGFITEGAASNAWIVEKEGRIRTRRLDGHILAGITRQIVYEAAKELGIEIREEKFSVEDAINAREAFNTGASSLVTPVTSIDGKKLGNGAVGPVVKALQDSFRKHTGS